MSDDIFDKMFKKNVVAESVKGEFSVKKLSPIDFVNVLFTKKNKPSDAVINDQYDQFMVNRFIACYQDFRTKEFSYLLFINSLNGKVFSNLEHFYCLYKKISKIDKYYSSYLWNKKDEEFINKKRLITALKFKFKYNDLGAEYAMLVISEEEKQFFLKEYEDRMKFLGIKV